MPYRLGRWYRRLIYPEDLGSGFPAPAELPWILEDCKSDGLILAPLLREWFIYAPEEREEEVAGVNYTSSDIRWFVGHMLREGDQKEELRISVRRDRFLCWSNHTELAKGTLIPTMEDPEQEWLIYMEWVQFVQTRGATQRKLGRIRRGYANWLRAHFPNTIDPLRLT